MPNHLLQASVAYVSFANLVTFVVSSAYLLSHLLPFCFPFIFWLVFASIKTHQIGS